MKNCTYFIAALTGFFLLSCSEQPDTAEKDDSSQKKEEVAEVKPTVSVLKSVERKALPNGTKPDGTFVYAGEWDDAEGKHIVTLARVFSSREDSEYEVTLESIHLYARHFLLDTTTNTYKETWKIKEFVNDCEFDLTADFIGSAIQISDENNNGIAEVWTMYKTACRSDVSPCALKLIMYEGAQKHAMRGSMRIDVLEEPMGGEYKFDNAFVQSDKAIQTYAKKLWEANKNEDLN